MSSAGQYAAHSGSVVIRPSHAMTTISLKAQIEAVEHYAKFGQGLAPALRAAAATLRQVRERDLQLSRILHEMAGSVSLCWIPKPTGEFDSTTAIEFVRQAIEEIRQDQPASTPDKDRALGEGK